MNNTIKPIVASVGAAFLLGAAVPAIAAENPFGAQQLSAGERRAARLGARAPRRPSAVLRQPARRPQLSPAS